MLYALAGLGVLVLLAIVSARRHALRSARELSLRRVVLRERDGEFEHASAYDFLEMVMLHTYEVHDVPPVESNTLYSLRRRDGPAWEVRLHPASVDHVQRRLTRDVENHRRVWGEGEASERDIASMEQSVRHVIETWQSIDDCHAPQVETAYERFVHQYKGGEDVTSLADEWRFLAHLEEEHEREWKDWLAPHSPQEPDVAEYAGSRSGFLGTVVGLIGAGIRGLLVKTGELLIPAWRWLDGLGSRPLSTKQVAVLEAAALALGAALFFCGTLVKPSFLRRSTYLELGIPLCGMTLDGAGALGLAALVWSAAIKHAAGVLQRLWEKLGTRRPNGPHKRDRET